MGVQSVSRSDRDTVSNYGVALIDCSWALIDSIPFHRLGPGPSRILPYLVV